MAARIETSPSLSDSLSFEESDGSDHEEIKEKAMIIPAYPKKENEDHGEKSSEKICILSCTDWCIQEKFTDNTVYMTHSQKPGAVFFAHVIYLKHVTPDGLNTLHRVLHTFELQLSGEYMLNISDIVHDDVHNTILIVYESCEGGTLHALIARANQYDEVLNEIEIQDWFIQLLLALKHIHTHKIKHLNISCNSLLLKNNSIRLTEPSQLKWLYKKPESAHTVLQSDVIVSIDTETKLAYAAPEVLESKPISEKADIWSAGCVLYEMCSRKRQFRAKTREELRTKIITGRLPKWPKGFPAHLETLWKRMMDLNPNKRPSVRELLADPILADHLQDMQLSIETPFPVTMPTGAGGYVKRQTPMPQFVNVEYEINSDDDDLKLTEEDTMKLLGLY